MTTAEKNLRDILGLKIPGSGRKNYSVKAGAGGGKTTLLSKRICQQILEGTPIEEFVIITYTNAAAAELREKITTELRSLISEGISDIKRLENARKALNSIELMQISTIHSFLFKILKENAFESKIVIDAQMLEEVDDKARRDKFFNKKYHEDFNFIESFGDTWVHTTKEGRKSDYKREIFANLFNDIANVREEIVYDVTDHTVEYEKMAVDYVSFWLPKLNLVSETIAKNPVIGKNGKSKELKKEAQTLCDISLKLSKITSYGIDEAKDLAEGVCALLQIHGGMNVYKGYANPIANIDEVVDSVCTGVPTSEIEYDFKMLYDTFLEKATDASKVVEYVCKLKKEYQNIIDNETRVLSNDDILYRAKKLLDEYPDVLDRIRAQYTKIYVDEFQDTTGLQADIVKLIAGTAGATLSDDKLLVVGDPKQSIYRFTGAEKAVYDEMDSIISILPNAESVVLDSNFRSNREIVDWVNDSFSKLMPSYTSMDTDWIIREPNALHGVFSYVPEVRHDEKDKEIKYNKDRDVEEVVSIVERLVDKSYCFIEECHRNADGSYGQPTLRTIKYSDIMIICKNTTNMANYVEAFATKGIPVNVQGKFKVDNDEILKNFIILVEYFASYKNKQKRIATSQIVKGIDATKVDISEIKTISDMLRDIRLMFIEKGYDSEAIIQYLLSKEELYLTKGKEMSPERVRSYRMRLHQMTETCLNNNDGDLMNIVYLMKDYVSNDVRREIPLESNENAIRFMNAHQSKGLTGNIVIIADRSAEEKCRYGGFKKGGKYYPAASVSYSEHSSAVTYPTYGNDLDMLKQVYADEMEESMRLQYVAATRAAHALIIMPSLKDKAWFNRSEYGYHSLKDFNAWISSREEDRTTYPLLSSTVATSHKTVRLQNLADNKEKADFSKLSDKQIVSITPSSLEPEGVTGYDYGDVGYVKEARPGANVFGTVMHRAYQVIFERYNRLKHLSSIEMEKAIERIINQAILESRDDMHSTDNPKEFLEFLKPKMLDYFIKIITPIIDEAEEIYTEYTFSFYVDSAERSAFISAFDAYFKMAKDTIEINEEPIWINGQADLVVKMKDGSIKVFDYKSDAMNGKPIADFEKSLSDKYEGQLALYRYAIAKAFGVDKVETEIIHLYK